MANTALLHADLAADETFRDRFTREAHIASLLRSPYTVPLLDSGTEAGRYFLVMRFVEGETVREALEGGPIEPGRALRIAAQVARSLEEAELRGIVHRDIKPDNIMLSEPGDATQVMDFGIARLEGSSALTATGAFIGTPLYAAPEAFGGAPDARSDIYSLGVTLYHMLAGFPPFQGDALEVLRQHRESAPSMQPLAGLPPEIVDAVLRCMAKDPADRYPTASELAGVLEQLAARATTRGDEPFASRPTEAITSGATRGTDTGAVTISLGGAAVRPAFLPRARRNLYELAFQNAGPQPIELRLAASAEAVEIDLPERTSDPVERQRHGHVGDQAATPPLKGCHTAVAVQRLRHGREWRAPPPRHRRRIRRPAGAVGALRRRDGLLDRPGRSSRHPVDRWSSRTAERSVRRPAG